MEIEDLEDEFGRSLGELEEDREALREKSIDELERDIDEIVFNLYGIESERKREMIRRYNNQYGEVQSIQPEEQ